MKIFRGMNRYPGGMERATDERTGMDQEAKQWLAAYRSGETEALGRLVEHYRRPLYAFILRMMEGHADAEEVFQEVWFRAVKNLVGYRDDRFLSWLFRIAHNLVIDRVRRTRPTVDLHAHGDEGDDPIQTQLADRRVDPGTAVAGRDLGKRIRAAVAALPPEQREVFQLRMESDIPFKEIARIQRTSINTALARMHYAVRKLRAELKDDYAVWMRGSS
jgi:RNA polymerase sigma-70 factor, ECF subfamily